jgi:transcriptional regulator with XRE-family HTH domain
MTDHPARRLLARRLRELRFKKGWSQETLAAQAGLHRTYISGIEREPLSRIPALRGISTSCTSERNIGLDNVEKLADAFDIAVGELLDVNG